VNVAPPAMATMRPLVVQDGTRRMHLWPVVAGPRLEGFHRRYEDRSSRVDSVKLGITKALTCLCWSAEPTYRRCRWI